MPLEQAIAPLPLDAIWAIEPHAAERIAQELKSYRGGMLTGGLSPVSSITEDGIAVVNVKGPMTREAGLLTMLFGGTSTLAVTDAVEAAAENPEVRAIFIRLDSPGGSVSGLAELADAVFAARQRKPVIAQACGMTASAALEIASQASEFYAHRMDMVGSVGTRMLFYDYSRAFQNEGIEAVPIDTGAFKSAGALGTEITAEQRAYFQKLVDEAQKDFDAALSRGRGLSAKQVEAIADGRMFYAPEAKGLGLIDGIQTEKESLAMLRAKLGSKKREKARMSAATYQEIVAACGGLNPSKAEDSQFVCDQLGKGVEIDAAARNWMQTLAARADLAREEAKNAAAEAARVKAEAEAAAKTHTGVDPLLDGGRKDKAKGDGYSGDAVTDFNVAVREKIAAGLPRDKAVIAAAKSNRELHKAFLLATNGRKAKSLIEDKFEQD